MKTKLSVAVLAATLSSFSYAEPTESDTVTEAESLIRTVTFDSNGNPVSEELNDIVEAALNSSLSDVVAGEATGSVDIIDDTIGAQSDPSVIFDAVDLSAVVDADTTGELVPVLDKNASDYTLSQTVDAALFAAAGADQGNDYIDSNVDDVIRAVNTGIQEGSADETRDDALNNFVVAISSEVDQALEEQLGFAGTEPQTAIVDGVASVVSTLTGEDPNAPTPDDLSGLPGEDNDGGDDSTPVQGTNPGQVDVNINGSVVTLPAGCGVATDAVTFTFDPIAQTDTDATYRSSEASISIANCEDATVSMSTTNTRDDNDRTIALAFQAEGTDSFVAKAEEDFSAELQSSGDVDPFDKAEATGTDGNLTVDLVAVVDGAKARENVGTFKAQDDEHVFVFIDGLATATP